MKELSRITKGIALREHVGLDIVETDEWRKRFDDLYDGQEVSKMKRMGYFFSSCDELESFMREFGIAFERLRDRVIKNGADIYIERYALNDEEIKKTRGILGDKNFFRQTDWVLYSSNIQNITRIFGE